METATAETFDLEVRDVSGQKHVTAEVPIDATVSELLEDLLERLNLGRVDAHGTPIGYRVRLDREARHLRGDERVGDALAPDDRVSLHPSADAGAGRRVHAGRPALVPAGERTRA